MELCVQQAQKHNKDKELQKNHIEGQRHHISTKIVVLSVKKKEERLIKWLT